MAWMERTARERACLDACLPGARSVVALSVSYYWGKEQHEGPLSVARYARGIDYHRWLKRRVRSLRRYLLALDPGCRAHPSVDTSPVLERAWAARAGIAWIGKSTMAIHPRLGTYTFLATLITDSVLVPTDPIPDRCGRCTACLDACPTDAFPEPGVLDARRCIAHWTLEAPGSLPPETPEFFGWVAGCDICQEVCPWNKFARAADEPRCRPKDALKNPQVELFTDPGEHEALEQALDRTALERNGPVVIRRNARRALGLPPLGEEEGDPEISVGPLPEREV